MSQPRQIAHPERPWASVIARSVLLLAFVGAFVAPACDKSTRAQTDLVDAVDASTPRDTDDLRDGDAPTDTDESDELDALDDAPDGDGEEDVERYDPSPLVVSDDFIYGVGAYDPSESSVFLWTRYLGDKKLVAIVYPQTSGASFVVGSEQRLEMPAKNDEGITIIEASGLKSSTPYRYFFVELDEQGQLLRRSQFGRFVTAPGEIESPVITFAHTSCAKGGYQPFTMLSKLAEEEISFFVFNGDVVYADGSKTLEEYRGFYRHNWSDGGLRALRAATGIYAILDDHEIDNNWNPETFDPARLTIALTAYREYVPLRIDPEFPDRLWRRQRWGRTLELIVLDSRTERLPSKKQYISPEQMEWLKARLSGTPATFKFIVNSVPIAKFPINNPDGWSGYDAQRNEILDYIETHEIKHVYWLSGDMHAAMVFDLGKGGWDLVASPIGQLHLNVWDFLSVLPEVKYINGGVNNYMLVTADPQHDPPQVRISIRKDDGSEIYKQTFE